MRNTKRIVTALCFLRSILLVAILTLGFIMPLPSAAAPGTNTFTGSATDIQRINKWETSYPFVRFPSVALTTPSDPLYGQQWGLPKIDAPSARERGSPAAASSPAGLAASSPRPEIVGRNDGVRYVAGELLIRFRPKVGNQVGVRSLATGKLTETGVASLDKLGATRGLQAMEPIFHQQMQEKARAAQQGLSPAPSLGDVYKLTFSADVNVEQLVTEYKADPGVAYAEPNYVYEFDGTPDDSYFSQQWYLHNTGQYRLADADIDAPEAWDIITGSQNIIIAVIDTGIDRDHPDLNEHIWTNPGEIPGNSVDDDGNGYVDDTWGWNWASHYPTDPDDFHADDPRDDNGHGTHVAGIAAAKTNNATGVAGVCWNCRVMSLKAFESNGTGTTSNIVQAINYAVQKGAHVINMSFGSYAESLLLQDTLAAAYGQAVLVAAAGNYGKTLMATAPYYPAAYPYVLGVGATDVGCVPTPQNCLQIAEHRADFSNYGVNAQVGAPGVSIYSTFRGGAYASLAGTSMAAPIVSGLAALLLSQHPTWSKEMARGQIIKTTDPIYVQPGTPFTSLGTGRVNAYQALTVVPTPDMQLLSDSMVYGDGSGDADGIPDAGETFTLTTLLKNYWGEAMTTTAILASADPYVTILSNTATFGNISAYATMRNTATPFRVALSDTAPNNHKVDLSLSITANGGAYTTSGAFSFLVQRGVELPGPLFPAVITQSMTLHNNYLYIVKQNMLVAQGVTLTIEPGTRLQFDPAKFIKVQGTLIASGTAELPIYFTSNQKDPQPGDFRGIIFDDQAIDAVLNPIPITTTIVTEGDTILGIGTVVTISNTQRFDTIGDVYFSAIISGTPNYEQVLHWYNGVGAIETSSDPLPDGSSSNVYSETVSLVDTAGSQSIVFAQPSDEYVSGSILNHVVLEYGGGVALEGAYPYVSNSTFRYSQGIAFTGQNCMEGIIAVNRTDGGQLVFTQSHVVDNSGWSMYVEGSQGRVVIAHSELSRNVEGEHIYDCGFPSGAASLQGPITVMDSDVRYNQVRFSYLDKPAGIYLRGNYGRLLRSHISNNQTAPDWPYYTSPGCIKLIDGPHVLRGNLISGNRNWRGVPAQGEFIDGGSAIQVNGASTLMSFNTIIGNLAYPNPFPDQNRPLPGPAILMYNYPGQNANQFTHNNILGNDVGGLFDDHGQPIPEYDLYLSNYGNSRKDMVATQNYWGTTDLNTIKYDMVYDYDNDFAPGIAYLDPILSAPEPLAPSFLLNATTMPPSPFGAQAMTVTLDFSRDMNTTITPTVTFGVDDPYTQQRIASGQWISPTRWVGTFDVTVDTGDGINTFKVSEAQDSNGMTIPEDTRFSFVIQTAGTASVLLEAAGGVSQVNLNWTQNDVTDLAGYILYRSVATNTAYSQIGGRMFVNTMYTDSSVTNGTTYYYKYSVIDTDFNEVAWSNEVSVTPDDYTLPTPPAVADDGATTHYFDRLHASWSSSDPETGIVEYQYCIGTATTNCDTVSWTSMGTVTETTKTGLALVNGQTYYVNVRARNSANHWSLLGASNGITVNKLLAPIITAVQPMTGVRTVAQVITLAGSGFQASPAPTVRLGDTALDSVSVLSANQVRATVPALIAAGAYTVTVTNYDTQVGTLGRAYTATNPAVGPRPFLLSPSTRRVGDDEASATVDIQIQDVSDLAAFQFDMTFDPALVQVNGVTLGWFLGSGGRATSALGPTINNTTGRVTFGGYSYGAGNSANGSGTLATITFAPRVIGTTSLTLANVQLRDSLNSEIPASPQNGQVQVVHYPFGDLDRDCDVDVLDIMTIASRWNTRTGDPNYYAVYDYDHDGDIDVADIMQTATAWGRTCGGGMMQMASGLDAAGPTLRLVPLRAQAQPGDRVDFSVEIQEADNVGGVQFDLRYDPTQFEFDTATMGLALSSTGNTAQGLPPSVDRQAGRVTLGGFSFGDNAGPGAGQLMRVTLIARPTARGATTVGLENIQLVNLRGQVRLPASVEPARLTIGPARLYLPLIVK